MRYEHNPVNWYPWVGEALNTPMLKIK
ncbi:MAG: hypothetical protein ACR2KZ_03595 [Segetibacter sp.]